MKTVSCVSRVLLGLVLLAAVAHADVLFTTTGAVSLTDPTQLGRISRNGFPSDWSAPKLFPGLINISTTYHYTEYDINVGLTPYIQVIFDSVSPNTFVAAFLGSYDPANMAATYLGDPGTSGNYWGVNPLSFQVVVPQGETLVLIVNNTASGNVGVGDPFNLIVEGYLDTEYTSTPEPSSLLLLGSGLVGAAGVIRRKLS